MRVKLVFPEQLIREPVIARLVRLYDVTPNIRRASVEERVGWMVLDLDGDAANIDLALAWLGEIGVEVDLLGDVLES